MKTNSATTMLAFMLFIFSVEAQDSLKADKISQNVEIQALTNGEMPAWANLIPYETFQEKLRNADFKGLSSNELSEEEKQFMNFFYLGLSGQEQLLIEELKKTYTNLEESKVKSILGEMLLEYLNNQGRYKEAVDFLALEEGAINSILSTFPAEEFLAMEDTLHSALTRNAVNHALVKVSINGHEEDMLFDTGADWSLLSESRANRMGVVMDDKAFDLSTSTSHVVTARFGYIRDFRVGHVLIKNHHVLVLNDESTLLQKDSISLDAGAILGWNAIRKLRVTLDDVDKRYSMTISKKKKSTLQNFFWMGYPGLKIVAENGQGLVFGFDAGSNSTEIANPFLLKLPHLQASKEQAKEGGIGGVEEREVAAVENIALFLSNHKFIFDKLTATGDQDFFLLHQDGTIGIDILKDNVVTIDFLNKELVIDTH